MKSFYRMSAFLTSALVAGLTLPGAAFASGGYVYAMNNAQGAGNNSIVVYVRGANGTLSGPIQTIGTKGGGSGILLGGAGDADSLGSQGSLMLDSANNLLFAVNTETASAMPLAVDCKMGSITSFRIDSKSGMLTFADNVPSGGLFPASLTFAGNGPIGALLGLLFPNSPVGIFYVLNAGGPGDFNACGIEPNITGFTVNSGGQMTPISSSTQSLNPGSMPGATIDPPGPLNCDPGTFPPPAICGENPPTFPRSPAQVAFTPNGDFLIVTVKGTNSIYSFPVNGSLPGTPVIYKAPGPHQPTYFGVTFDPSGNLIVAEPFGTSASVGPTFAPGTSAASSFSIGKDGHLTPITTDLGNGQALSCWVVTDPTGQYAYVSNNGNGAISSYKVTSKTGVLTLLSGTAGATGAGGRPNDMAVVRDGKNSYLYALDSTNGAVDGWTINSDGSLTSLGTVTGLLANTAQGLAAY